MKTKALERIEANQELASRGRFVVRVVGPAGAERYLECRYREVGEDNATILTTTESALALAEAYRTYLHMQRVHIDVVDLDDAERIIIDE